jgi:LDH2 family malate/lactate/ureidoglycolate dehydrogenase
MKRHRTAELEQWTTEVFEQCGLSPAHAAISAACLVRTEARGYKTHGLTRVPSYIERLQTGVFNPRPHMSYQSTVGGTVVDADGAIGQVAATYATDLGLAALTTKASVFVAVQACGHLGALGIYALKAADAGALCLIGQRTPPALALAGFSGPAIGDNPIAFGCPNPNSQPIVFDVACSVG